MIITTTIVMTVTISAEMIATAITITTTIGEMNRGTVAAHVIADFK